MPIHFRRFFCNSTTTTSDATPEEKYNDYDNEYDDNVRYDDVCNRSSSGVLIHEFVCCNIISNNNIGIGGRGRIRLQVEYIPPPKSSNNHRHTQQGYIH